jgi:hypothetical protein
LAIVLIVTILEFNSNKSKKMPSALLIHGVPVECINKAAITYNIPATLIVSVLLTENGRIGSATPNQNGTFDYGPMQINTIWLDKIREYGYTKYDVQYDPCANVFVGAWILSQRVADAGVLWYGVGSYNSYTPDKNHRYRNKVSNIYQMLSNYLSNPTPGKR